MEHTDVNTKEQKSLSGLKGAIKKYIEVLGEWRNFEKIITDYLKCYRHFRKVRRLNFLKKEITDEADLAKKIDYYENNPIEIQDKIDFTIEELFREHEPSLDLKEKIKLILEKSAKDSLNFKNYDKVKYNKYKFHKVE